MYLLLHYILIKDLFLVELALELFYKLLAPQSVAHSLSPQSVKYVCFPAFYFYIKIY